MARSVCALRRSENTIKSSRNLPDFLMRASKCIATLPLFLSVIALGQQLDSNTVTVTASRNRSLQPDSAVFGVLVETGFDPGLDDVAAALAGSGITAANFTDVSSSLGLFLTDPVTQSGQSRMEWTFSLQVPV